MHSATHQFKASLHSTTALARIVEGMPAVQTAFIALTPIQWSKVLAFRAKMAEPAAVHQPVDDPPILSYGLDLAATCNSPWQREIIRSMRADALADEQARGDAAAQATKLKPRRRDDGDTRVPSRKARRNAARKSKTLFTWGNPVHRVEDAKGAHVVAWPTLNQGKLERLL